MHLQMGFKDSQNCDFCGRLFVQACGKSTHMKKCDGKVEPLHYQPIKKVKSQTEVQTHEKNAQISTNEVSVANSLPSYLAPYSSKEEQFKIEKI